MPTEVSDPGNMHNLANGQFTIPAGKTMCILSGYFTGDPNNMFIGPWKNGTNLGMRCSDTDTNGPGWSPVNCHFPVAAADVIEIRPANANMAGSTNDRMELSCF